MVILFHAIATLIPSQRCCCYFIKHTVWMDIVYSCSASRTPFLGYIFWLWVLWFNHLLLSNSIAHSGTFYIPALRCIYRDLARNSAHYISLNGSNAKVLLITGSVHELCVLAVGIATAAAAVVVVVLAHTQLIKYFWGRKFKEKFAVELLNCGKKWGIRAQKRANG